LKVVIGAAAPFFHVVHVVIGDVHDCDPGTQEGTERLVKSDQPGRDDIAGGCGILRQDLGANGGAPQAFALHREVRQLIDRVEEAEVTVELQTIDDSGLGGEADVLGPEIAVCVDDLPLAGALFEQIAVQFEKSGKVRVLGVASLTRLASMPNLPTIAESGFPGYDAYPWFGVVGPAGMPRDIVALLSSELAAAVGAPEMNKRLRGMFMEPATATPEAFAELMRSDLARWSRVVRDAKIHVD